MRASRVLRPAAAVSLVSLVTLGAWACFGLIDPAGGFLVHLEVTAPDTVRLGEDGTAVVQAVDETGRRIETPNVQWTLDPVAMFGAAPPTPTSEFHFHPELPGVGFLTADLAGGPLRSREGPVQAIVWSLAQGVQVGSQRGDRVAYLGLNDTLTLQARVLTVNGTPVPGGEAFEWKFLQRSGAVDALKGFANAGDLLIRGYGKGEEAVQVSHRFCQGPCADTIVIRVAMVPNTIRIEPIPQLTYIGQQVGLGATVTDTAGRPIAAPVQWALANPADSVVVGLQDNMVEARGNGSALVNATFSGLSASATIDVWQQAASITLDPAAPPDLTEGQRDTVRVHAVDAGGHALLRPLSLSAYADNPAVVAVAVIDGGIERTGQTSGTTMVNLDAEGLWFYFLVNVSPVLDSLDVRIGRDTLHFIGSTTVAEAWGLRGTVWSPVSASFASSDSSVATIQSDGRIIARAGGATWIRASAGGQADSARLVVDQVVASLSSNPAAAMVVNGGSVSLRATAYDSGGGAIPDAQVLWGTSNPTVAQVDGGGVVTAVGTGFAYVSLTSGGQSRQAPVTVVPPLAGAAVGGAHLCAIATGGALYCMGYNGSGQLGDGTLDDHGSVPVRSAPSLAFNQVAAGTYFTCGIATDAHTYCWGDNSSGQLGNGTIGSAGSPIPAPVQADPGFVSLSASESHVCAVTQGGVAYCWGSNHTGEAGVGHTNPVSIPTPVTGGLLFRSVSAGWGSTCGVAADSVAYCWGGGVSAPVPLSTPVRFLAFTSMCGIATDGTLYCRSESGVTPVPGGGIYRSLSGGGGFHCAVGDDLHVYCFGYNSSGELGTGDFDMRGEPTRTLLSGQGDLVAAGNYAACARKVGGGLSCWGASFSFYTPTPFPVIYP